MSDKEYDRISDKVYKSYPNACICWIEQVEHPGIRKRFEEYRGRMICKEPQVLEFFHGSNPRAINTIVERGFEAIFNRRSAAGRGTYFARDVLVSMGYTAPEKGSGISYVILSDILIGNSKMGYTDEGLDMSKYDNFGDAGMDSSIVVIPHDEAIVPKYVIAFYQNTK